MITFLEGTLVEKHPTRVVVDVGGVGYEVFIPLGTYDALPKTGGTCRILTFDYVREDTHQLFGFMDEEDRRMFVMLMGTSGIGPKLALSALSGLSVRELKAAIVEGDIKRLSSISGVGRKMAERMAVELKDKIGDIEGLEALSGAGAVAKEDGRLRDAIMALIALGYKQDAARKMISGVLSKSRADTTLEEVVRKALSG